MMQAGHAKEGDMNDQSRTFSRVETRIKGHARLVDGPHVQPIFTGCASCSQDIRMEHIPASEFPPQAARMLTAMNAKLDMILARLDQQNIREDFPIPMDVIEISAAGLQFTSKHQFEKGQHLEAVIILSSSPVQMAGIVGTIVRRESHQGKTVYVVGYETVRDPDREAIIQFVFQEQREHIRRGKNAS
jgi:hypothetical protein